MPSGTSSTFTDGLALAGGDSTVDGLAINQINNAIHRIRVQGIDLLRQLS